VFCHRFILEVQHFQTSRRGRYDHRVKIKVPRSKPRNPLVPAAAKRKAGKHQKSGGGQRQSQQRDVDQEVIQLLSKHRAVKDSTGTNE
jgi:hypothetical protein